MSAAKSKAEEWHAPSGEHGHRSFLIRPRSPLEGQYHHLRFLFPHRIQFDHDHHWRPASPFTFLSLSLILIGHDCHRFCANLLTIVYCHDIAPPSLYIGSLRLHCDGDITHTHTLLNTGIGIRVNVGRRCGRSVQGGISLGPVHSKFNLFRPRRARWGERSLRPLRCGRRRHLGARPLRTLPRLPPIAQDRIIAI
jgi:hypothetical protein